MAGILAGIGTKQIAEFVGGQIIGNLLGRWFGRRRPKIYATPAFPISDPTTPLLQKLRQAQQLSRQTMKENFAAFAQLAGGGSQPRQLAAMREAMPQLIQALRESEMGGLQQQAEAELRAKEMVNRYTLETARMMLENQLANRRLDVEQQAAQWQMFGAILGGLLGGRSRS